MAPTHRCITIVHALSDRHNAAACKINKDTLRAAGVSISVIGEVPAPMAMTIRVAYLGNNTLLSLHNIEQFVNVEVLSLCNNLLEFMEDLAPLASLANLKELSINGNPISRIPFFKSYVISLCRSLRKLDGELIDDAARADAELVSKQVMVAIHRAVHKEMRNALFTHLLGVVQVNKELRRAARRIGADAIQLMADRPSAIGPCQMLRIMYKEGVCDLIAEPHGGPLHRKVQIMLKHAHASPTGNGNSNNGWSKGFDAISNRQEGEWQRLCEKYFKLQPGPASQGQGPATHFVQDAVHDICADLEHITSFLTMAQPRRTRQTAWRSLSTAEHEEAEHIPIRAHQRHTHMQRQNQDHVDQSRQQREVEMFTAKYTKRLQNHGRMPVFTPPTGGGSTQVHIQASSQLLASKLLPTQQRDPDRPGPTPPAAPTTSTDGNGGIDRTGRRDISPSHPPPPPPPSSSSAHQAKLLQTSSKSSHASPHSFRSTEAENVSSNIPLTNSIEGAQLFEDAQEDFDRLNAMLKALAVKPTVSPKPWDMVQAEDIVQSQNMKDMRTYIQDLSQRLLHLQHAEREAYQEHCLDRRRDAQSEAQRAHITFLQLTQGAHDKLSVNEHKLALFQDTYRQLHQQNMDLVMSFDSRVTKLQSQISDNRQSAVHYVRHLQELRGYVDEQGENRHGLQEHISIVRDRINQMQVLLSRFPGYLLCLRLPFSNSSSVPAALRPRYDTLRAVFRALAGHAARRRLRGVLFGRCAEKIPRHSHLHCHLAGWMAGRRRRWLWKGLIRLISNARQRGRWKRYVAVGLVRTKHRWFRRLLLHLRHHSLELSNLYSLQLRQAWLRWARGCRRSADHRRQSSCLRLYGNVFLLLTTFRRMHRAHAQQLDEDAARYKLVHCVRKRAWVRRMMRSSKQLQTRWQYKTAGVSARRDTQLLARALGHWTACFRHMLATSCCHFLRRRLHSFRRHCHKYGAMRVQRHGTRAFTHSHASKRHAWFTWAEAVRSMQRCRLMEQLAERRVLHNAWQRVRGHMLRQLKRRVVMLSRQGMELSQGVQMVALVRALRRWRRYAHNQQQRMSGTGISNGRSVLGNAVVYLQSQQQQQQQLPRTISERSPIPIVLDLHPPSHYAHHALAVRSAWLCRIQARRTQQKAFGILFSKYAHSKRQQAQALRAAARASLPLEGEQDKAKDMLAGLWAAGRQVNEQIDTVQVVLANYRDREAAHRIVLGDQEASISGLAAALAMYHQQHAATCAQGSTAREMVQALQADPVSESNAAAPADAGSDQLAEQMSAFLQEISQLNHADISSADSLQVQMDQLHGSIAEQKGLLGLRAASLQSLQDRHDELLDQRGQAFESIRQYQGMLATVCRQMAEQMRDSEHLLDQLHERIVHVHKAMQFCAEQEQHLRGLYNGSSACSVAVLSAPDDLLCVGRVVAPLVHTFEQPLMDHPPLSQQLRTPPPTALKQQGEDRDRDSSLDDEISAVAQRLRDRLFDLV